MNDRPSFWFPVKRYGWGWGLPVRWQGWVVFGAYAALLYGGIYYFKAQRNTLALLIYLLALTAVLIVIVAIKGEQPLRWRWGGDGR
jgi:drug/metabolite transporter (DMT)-like permease